MAKSDPNPNCTRVTMTIPEVHSLAERLLADGQAEPGELRRAAKALQALTRAYNRHDFVTLDCP